MPPFPDYNSIKSACRTSRMVDLKAGQKVLIVVHGKDDDGYYGTVVTLRKPSLYVVDVDVPWYYRNGDCRIRWKQKVESFRNRSNMTIYLVEEVSSDAVEDLAAKRRAYAQHRKALLMARGDEEVAFSLVGMSIQSTLEDFKKKKKELMLLWHPDRWHVSGIEQDDFLRQSKKYLDALSYVEQYLTKRERRIQ